MVRGRERRYKERELLSDKKIDNLAIRGGQKEVGWG
jgi:hypothetical protein